MTLYIIVFILHEFFLIFYLFEDAYFPPDNLAHFCPRL